MPHGRLSRRRVLGLVTALPIGALLAACSGEGSDEADEVLPTEGALFNANPAASTPIAAPPTATPTATPEPFVMPAGEESHRLMPGTPYETPYYSFATGRLGPIVMVLGGVHGNEPGGWLAAERLVEQVRPDAGALLVVPRANHIAVDLFERTTDELGDLNRLYPGDRNGLPMAQMAFGIVEALRRFHVTHLIDMHESWSFYRDRTETATGTAYLGQTLSTPGEPGATLARDVVESVNATSVQAAHEEFVFRQWPPPGGIPTTPTRAPADAATPLPGSSSSRRSRSSLGLPNHIDGLSAILVEMGQQQDLERRIQLHVDVVQQALRLLDA